MTRLSTAFVGAVSCCLVAAATTAGASTTVVTVAGNTNVVRTPMEQQLQGSLCKAPTYSCQRLEYRSSGIGADPLDKGAELLQTVLSQQSGPTMVFAYSQGGMLSTTWLDRFGDQVDPARRDEIVFVLVGSPQNGKGGFGPAVGSKSRPATPTDTGFTIIEVTREYDMESDFPTDKGNLLAVANAYAGFFGVHTDYTKVDLHDPDNLITQEGGTTYVLVPTEHLPLLAPLRRMGLVTLADSLETRWRPIIDAAYDRSEYTTLGDAMRDGRELPSVLTEGAPSPQRSVQAATVSASRELPSADPDTTSLDAASTESEDAVGVRASKKKARQDLAAAEIEADGPAEGPQSKASDGAESEAGGEPSEENTANDTSVPSKPAVAPASTGSAE